jgi:signal transduction histidine kinase/DNA-binding response OmpR family regulator
MTAYALRGVIPEFVDAEIEQAFRQWSVPDTVRQARAALWVAVFAVPLFAINDIRLLGVGPAAATQIALRCVLVAWSAMLLGRLRRPIDVGTLHWHLLAWAVALDMQAMFSATSRPPDFAPMLMTNQTVLFALVVFWPLRFVARAVNGASFAVALVVVLRATGTLTPTIVVPLSISVFFALAAGLPLVRQVERLRREEFARAQREKAQLEELRVAKEAAEAADRAKTRFLAVVSHEVRTPMNGVLGVLQLLEGSRLDALQRRQVAIARDCAESLTSLLDTIIDYVRLGTAIEAPVAVDFDPRQLVHSVVELLRPRAVAQQTAVQVQIDASVSAGLHADASKLRQVLINLLSNAIKFTEQGQVDVKLSSRTGDDGEQWLELVVEDDGIGISPDKLVRIFDEFMQADDSISRRFGGAGLGLAVCKRLIQVMGGTIVVTSEMGAGSRFCAAVRVAVAGAMVTAAPVSSAARRLKLLVVDDDPINQIVVCGLLAQAGHDATPVSSGAAAIAETGRERFDAVFMDLHMPLMDGIEAARRIRALSTSEHSTMPIVALTADLLQMQSAGFTELFSSVVAKPIRRDALRRVLAVIGANAASPRQAPARNRAANETVDLLHLSEHVEALGVAAVGRLAHQFRRTGRRLLSELAETVTREDAHRTQELAHRLASSASALGLMRLGGFAERLEQAASQGKSPELVVLATTLGIEFERSFEALREIAREAKAAQRTRQVPQSTAVSSR